MYFCLVDQGLKVERQKELPIHFEDKLLNAGLRLDLLIEGRVILELKAVERILPVHEAQIYSYLKLSKLRLGLLLNFNVKLMKQGIKRFVM